MKRLNPQNGKPFKFGDARDDGYLFWQYKNKLKSTGFFAEQWLSPISFEKQVGNQAKHKIENSEKYNAQRSKWHADNRTRSLSNMRIWAAANRSKNQALKTKYKVSKLCRTPKWLTKTQLEEIQDFYIIAKMFQLYTGELYHVDHIIPLQGESVSGLHVPWNLQVLPAIQNLTKSNSHE